MSGIDKKGNSQFVNYVKRSVATRIALIRVTLAITYSLSTRLIAGEYLTYFQSIQLSIAGYLVTELYQYHVLIGDYCTALWSDSKVFEESHKDSWSSCSCSECSIVSQSKRWGKRINW